eukprot:13840467-Alexandrium_andersonii.AAC.1
MMRNSSRSPHSSVWAAAPLQLSFTAAPAASQFRLQLLLQLSVDCSSAAAPTAASATALAAA